MKHLLTAYFLSNISAKNNKIQFLRVKDTYEIQSPRMTVLSEVS